MFGLVSWAIGLRMAETLRKLTVCPSAEIVADWLAPTTGLPSSTKPGAGTEHRTVRFVIMSRTKTSRTPFWSEPPSAGRVTRLDPSDSNATKRPSEEGAPLTLLALATFPEPELVLEAKSTRIVGKLSATSSHWRR